MIVHACKDSCYNYLLLICVLHTFQLTRLPGNAHQKSAYAVSCCVMQLGDKAHFDWHWTGLDSGLTQCKIDGKGTVSMAGNCSSPLTYTVRTNLNQTLTVLYTDVCGKHHNASLTFGPSFGWAVEAKESGQGSLQLAGSGSSQSATLQKNSGSALHSSGAARTLLQMLAAAVAAAVPVMWM